MMNGDMYQRDALLNDLRQNVVEIHFTKANGEDRVMRCTLLPGKLPPQYVNEEKEERDFHAKNQDTIAVWDIQKGGWRSFRIDSVRYAQILDNA
jgi:hypothetical protein